ncbi:MAG: AtpZ/AtpI family protein [Candidatus Binatia bacterium]
MWQKENLHGNKLGKRKPPFANLAKYVAIGLEFPSTIIGGLFLGYLIDLYFDTSPWFTMTLALLAFVGAVFRLVKWLQRFSGDQV